MNDFDELAQPAILLDYIARLEAALEDIAGYKDPRKSYWPSMGSMERGAMDTAREALGWVDESGKPYKCGSVGHQEVGKCPRCGNFATYASQSDRGAE
jgi:hypothetical protein